MYKKVMRSGLQSQNFCAHDFAHSSPALKKDWSFMYVSIVLFFGLFSSLTQSASDFMPLLEIKPSYFFFYASPLKDIYHKGGVEVQGSASVNLCRHLDFYGSIGYRKVHGHALSSCAKIRLTIIPIDIGLKPTFNFGERFVYFFAMGPRYFHLHQHNNSLYVDRTITGNGIGLFINTGFNTLLSDCLLLGIFGEYSYEKKKTCPNMSNVFSNGSVQMDGFAFGISLGYAF